MDEDIVSPFSFSLLELVLRLPLATTMASFLRSPTVCIRYLFAICHYYCIRSQFVLLYLSLIVEMLSPARDVRVNRLLSVSISIIMVYILLFVYCCSHCASLSPSESGRSKIVDSLLIIVRDDDNAITRKLFADLLNLTSSTSKKLPTK